MLELSLWRGDSELRGKEEKIGWIEGYLVAEIEDDDNAISSLVVSICDGSVSLLPGSVPLK